MTSFDPKIEAKREIARRELARRHLLPFVQRFNPEYRAGWVHKDIAAKLEQFSQDVINKKSPRLMLFMPPRHGKSELASRCFPAWHLGHNPRHEIISCSYSGALSMTFSRRVRAMMRDSEYRLLFKGTSLDPDSQSIEAWLTTEGGGLVSSGVGGAITGRGAHILLIDDPTKNREEAESETTRQSIKDWYTSTAYTRLAPGGGVLLIQTRWHMDDLAGFLLAEQETGGDEWNITSYPAIAEEDETYRLEGQALHPERYPIEALERIKRAVGVRDWFALYQQSPVSDDGAYFTRPMLKYYDPDDLDEDRLVIYCAWDLAIGKKERNDYSVGVVAGVDDEDRLFVLDVKRGKWDGGELVDEILDQYEDYEAEITGIEQGQISMAIGPFLETRIKERGLYKMYVKDLKTGRRDKEARGRAIQGRMAQGMVYLPVGKDWTEKFVAELLTFPVGKHDDQVDAFSWLGQMMHEFHRFREGTEAPPPSWRDRLPGMFRSDYKSAMSA